MKNKKLATKFTRIYDLFEIKSVFFIFLKKEVSNKINFLNKY